ncbi:MAG TPA: hypothetical protein VK907_06680 [Phnomibacter sp.]|nr:hypothetical protein [Phnomibacter sp.]
MKIVFTSLLMMIMAMAQAMPVMTDSLDNGKKSKGNASVPVSTATMSMQQLQEENATLKARLVALENQLEEEKGMLQYRYTMLNVVNQLEDRNKQEKLEDLRSQVNFSKLMSNTLLMVRNDVGK